MSTPDTPTAPEPAIQRGARLLAEGDADAAVAVLRGLVAEAPIYAAAHVMLAASLDAAGRTDEGLDVWHHAAFLVPSSRLVQRKRLRLPEPHAPTAAPDPPAPAAPSPTAEPTTEPMPDATPAASPWAPTAPEPAPEAEHRFDTPTAAHAAETDASPSAPHDDVAPTPAFDSETPTATYPVPPADPFGDAPLTEAPSTEASEPEGARMASPDELFSELPTAAASPESAAPVPDARARDAVSSIDQEDPTPSAAEHTLASPPAAPDWGDLDDPAVSVLPPDAPDATPPPASQDSGGWTLLAEREHSAPTRRGVVLPVISPEAWTPPEEPEAVRLPGAPTVPLDAEPRQPATPETYPETALADDLDALIESLGAAPRITPDPDFDGPSPDRASDHVDDIASETLAKIYAAQKQYMEAAVVYERLAARTPERAEDLLARAAEMRRSAS